MINKVIHQIVDLDKRAIQIKDSATARAEKIVTDTKDHLKEEETKVITGAKEESKRNYDTEIRKANAEKQETIDAMTKEVATIRKRYEKVKVESARNVLDELFRSV